MPTHLNRRGLLLAIGASCAGLGLPALASDGRPLRFIVPTPPGSAGDALGRALSFSWSKVNGQTTVVENIAGAGSLVGTKQLARAPKDGSTLGVMSSNHTIIPWLFKELPFDAVADFTPIGMVGSLPMMLVAHPRVAASTPAELARFARDRSQPLAEGLVTGSVYQIASEVVREQAGFSTNRVFYKGTAQITTDLLAGVLDVAFISAQGAAPHVAAGRLKALAVSTPKRTDIAPQVPTLQEAGFPKFEVDVWLALMGPGGLAPEVAALRRRELDAALADADLIKALQMQGIQPRRMEAGELVRFIRAESERNRQVIQRIGIKVE